MQRRCNRTYVSSSHNFVSTPNAEPVGYSVTLCSMMPSTKLGMNLPLVHRSRISTSRLCSHYTVTLSYQFRLRMICWF